MSRGSVMFLGTSLGTGITMSVILSFPACSTTSEPALARGCWRVLNTTSSAVAAQETHAVIQKVEAWFAQFGDQPVHASDGEFTVVLHALPGPDANQITMTAQTGVVRGRYHATVHCLWEDPAPGSSRLRWFRKNAAHEVASVYCDVLTRKKGTGWRFHEAPSWFVQGLPEWIGKSLYDPSWEGRPLPADAPKAEAIDGVDPDGNIAPRNVYDGGSWLVERLVRAHGASALHRLLKEDARTFEAAFVRVFGVSQRDFASQL
jgi:hypothetical protein